MSIGWQERGSLTIGAGVLVEQDDLIDDVDEKIFVERHIWKNELRKTNGSVNSNTSQRQEQIEVTACIARLLVASVRWGNVKIEREGRVLGRCIRIAVDSSHET
jgi:hypothetical protein